jgi:hypothetical protein
MHKRSRCSGFLRVFLVPIEYVWKRNIAKVVFKLLTLVSPGSHSHNQPKGVSHILYTVGHILPQPEICNLTSEESQSVVLLLHFLKGQCHEIFCFSFFHESVSPKPLIIPIGLFQIFFKIRGDIRSSRCTTGVVDTGGKWKKSSIIKIFFILLDTFG